MTWPMPNIHAPMPAALPIKEAIKETFSFFMARVRLDYNDSITRFNQDD